MALDTLFGGTRRIVTLPASMGGNKTPFIDEEELYNGADSFVEEYHRGLLDGTIKPEFKEAPKKSGRCAMRRIGAWRDILARRRGGAAIGRCGHGLCNALAGGEEL